MTTANETARARLRQAVEKALDLAISENEAVNGLVGVGHHVDEPLTEGRAAFRQLVTDYENEVSRLRAFVADKANYKPLDGELSDFTRGIVTGHSQWAAEARALLAANPPAASGGSGNEVDDE